MERGAQNSRVCARKTNIRITLPSPGAAARFENLGGFFDQSTLLLSCELHHAPAFVRHTKRRENPFRNPEIGMIHMRPLDRRRNFQRHFSKLIASHMLWDVIRTIVLSADSRASVLLSNSRFFSVADHLAAHGPLINAGKVLFHCRCEQ
jgi:hypothetical protein